MKINKLLRGIHLSIFRLCERVERALNHSMQRGVGIDVGDMGLDGQITEGLDKVGEIGVVGAGAALCHASAPGFEWGCVEVEDDQMGGGNLVAEI